MAAAILIARLRPCDDATRPAPPAAAVVAVGAGSYALTPPPGAGASPARVRWSSDIDGPTPTNRFWSSLTSGGDPLPFYPQPLAVHPTKQGLRVYAPGPSVTANRAGVFGALSDQPDAEDLTLGASAGGVFESVAVEGVSDWFVDVGFEGDAVHMKTAVGHGSPYVYAMYERGGARLTFAARPTLWSGGPSDATLGVTIRGRPYALFGPRGSTWAGLGTAAWTNRPEAGERHFSLALLPEATKHALKTFERYAHAHVIGSKASWAYDPVTGVVTTTFAVETKAREGTERGTLFALYPHQWAHTDAEHLPGWEYASVRGAMRLIRGGRFATTLLYPGILPALPPRSSITPERVHELVSEELARSQGPPLDSYWEAKLLGRLAAIVSIAEATDPAAARELVGVLRQRLERRFTAADEAGEPKASDRFEYDETWGTLIARPAAYGSDTSLNDHHLHYGYVIRAAAEVARFDPEWAKSVRFGGMVDLVIRDVAASDRSDPLFPFLRCFDVYAGHSWASGDARSLDGPNLESSSESMNAWSAIILWAQATGDRTLLDLGVYLYTTELSAIESYWFDVEGRSFPPGLERQSLTMIWGGKAVPATWFSEEPEAIYGINWLPFHGGSLYLGRYPKWVARNYAALRRERGSEAWRMWPDLMMMFQALSDPAAATRQLETLGPAAALESGNSRLNLEHWVGALGALGQVNRAVTADHPLYAVFERGSVRTHVAYRMPREAPFTVTFSDGATVRCDSPGFSLDR